MFLNFAPAWQVSQRTSTWLARQRKTGLAVIKAAINSGLRKHFPLPPLTTDSSMAKQMTMPCATTQDLMNPLFHRLITAPLNEEVE